MLMVEHVLLRYIETISRIVDYSDYLSISIIILRVILGSIDV